MQLPNLGDSENLGRSVFSSSYTKRARKGIVIPEIFLGPHGEDSISVDRMDHVSRTVLAELSKERGQNRIPSRDFYGWAIVKASDAALNGRTIQATPDDTNKYHADIFLNLPDNDERRDIQKQHAVELATRSEWQDAPE